MMYYLILFISFFIFAILVKVKGSIFTKIATNSVSLVNTLLASNEDEDETIKQVQASTSKLLSSLLNLMILIVSASVVASVPLFIFVITKNEAFYKLDFTSLYSIIAISLGATLPFIIPSSKKKKNNYSELSRLLHRMSLDNYNINKKLFSVEQKRIKRKDCEPDNKFVIITGLARSGTTSLMNKLADLSIFVSLSYANMPFVLSPNLWKRIYKPKNNSLSERSHKDGVKFGYNTTEALEEYFFKVKANDNYINEAFLNEYSISYDDYTDYLYYQLIVKNSSEKIYLAKNNNFILRYKSVRGYNDDFLMVIMFREPVSHAASLLEMHNKYKRMQSEDDFVLEYMNWLGHHEFGLNQKQFVFENNTQVIEGDKDKIDYWLKIWINYYRYVSEINHRNTIFINYDDFCKAPGEIICSITKRFDLSINPANQEPFKNTRKPLLHYSEEIRNEAIKYYKIMLDKGVSAI